MDSSSNEDNRDDNAVIGSPAEKVTTGISGIKLVSEEMEENNADKNLNSSNKIENQKNISSICDEEEETDLYCCSLGTHGQIVLIHQDTDAVLSRFEFSYPANFKPRNQAWSTTPHSTNTVTTTSSLTEGTSVEEQTGRGGKGSCSTAPHAGVPTDEDGDLLVPRRGDTAVNKGVIMIEHQQSTSLELVGEQVWRGAFYLADYLLHSAAAAAAAATSSTTSGGGDLVDVTGCTVLELASGVGLTSIVAAMMADTVLVTDMDRGNILNLIRSNIERNKDLFLQQPPTHDTTNKNRNSLPSTGSTGTSLDNTSSTTISSTTTSPFTTGTSTISTRTINTSTNPTNTSTSPTNPNTSPTTNISTSPTNTSTIPTTSGRMLVRELDFCQPSTITALEPELRGVTVLLAADVVYNNELTDSFFSAVHRLMSSPPDKIMLVALEKRYVFTLADMDTVAPCYEYFLQGLARLQATTTLHPDVATATAAAGSSITTSCPTSLCWQVTEVTEDFPQYFVYERTKHLVLWRIQAQLVTA